VKKIFVLGSLNIDLTFSSILMPENGETVKGNFFSLNSGGKGANQATAASKQNVEVYLIGSVGKDEFGFSLLNSLESSGVDVRYVEKNETASTGVASILLHNGDNRIIIIPGANQMITKEMIDLGLKDADEGDIFISQLENNIDAVEYGFQFAKKKRMLTIFNPSPIEKFNKLILNGLDYLITNEIECQKITSFSYSDGKKAFEYLIKKGVKNLIITLGNKGSIFFSKTQIIKTPALNIKPIDTTGAGDTFLGVLASTILKGKPIKESLAYSSICSGMSCLKKGAQTSMPTQEEAERFIISNKLLL